MLKVLYFASLREAFSCESEVWVQPLPATVSALIDALRARGGAWTEALGPTRRWRVAVNQEMATLTTALAEGDEVAIFPPVTGG